MIRFNEKNRGPIAVNKEHIATITPDDQSTQTSSAGTVITMSHGASYAVDEPFEQVLAMLRVRGRPGY